MTPAVPGLPARGSDRFGLELGGDVLPQSLQDGINPVVHQGASLCDGVVEQRHRAGRPFSSQALRSPGFILNLVPFLSCTKISDVGLRLLKNFPAIEVLKLIGTRVGDGGLAHLSTMRTLRVLVLVGTSVTDAGLTHLGGMTNLQTLYLWDTPATDAGVEILKRALPGLELIR